MDALLQSLLHDWDHLGEIRYKMLKYMPEYSERHHDFFRFDAQIRAALGPEFMQFDAARGAYMALSERASMLTGAHVALKLLISLL